MLPTRSRPAGRRGFSLIELALALLVVMLLAGAAARLTLTLARRGEVDRTRAELDETRTALRGFLALHGRLPCPDGKSDGAESGLEDFDGQGCVRAEGFVPYATLGGIGRHDAWGRRLRYRVVSGLARVPNEAADPIRICEGDAGGGCGRVVADNVAALILSLGENGHGAGGRAVPAASLHERVNAVDDGGAMRVFISHEPRGAGGEGGAFDDVVVWLPYSVHRATLLDR